MGRTAIWSPYINLSILNLTPFIPLSCQERGKRFKRGGFAPSLTVFPLPLSREGGRGMGF
jgi:hypothetical protein